jgi:hypothetical protein
VTYSTGYLLDTPGTWLPFACNHPAANRFKAATAKRPTSGGPDAFAPGIYDQTRVGACAGESVACAEYTLLGVKGYPPAAPLSGRGAYALARQKARADMYPTRKPADMPPLEDGGANPSQVWAAVLKYGLGNVFELDAGSLILDAALATAPLNGSELIACDGRRPPVTIEITEIPADEPDKVDQLLDALASGHPACIPIDGGCDKFQGYTGGIMDWADGPMDLDHLVTVTYFSTDAAGAPIFKIRNSWGTGYGDDGCVRVTANFIRSAGGLLVPGVVQ